MDDTLLYRIAFASLRGMNPQLAGQILGRIGGEDAFFKMSERELSTVMGFGNKLFDGEYRRRLLDEAERETVFVDTNHINPIYFSDEGYPHRLLQCDDAPLMLYTLGRCELNNARFVSVVGTRHATVYGIDFTNRLVEGLVQKMTDPLVIVSGLAYGIDIAAHKAALACNTPTVAVLAQGLNTIYPPVHRTTAVEIARSGGMLMTDYRSIDRLHKGNFLARNRIVAGLSDCLVVVESAAKGGALVTARIAAGYSRDVFALPGRVSDRYSEGCNRLIYNNVAQLVTSPEDILSAMRWPEKEQEGQQGSLFVELAPDEEKVIEVIRRRGDARIAEISAEVEIPVSRLLGMLVDLEFRNLILSMPGGRYRLQ